MTCLYHWHACGTDMPVTQPCLWHSHTCDTAIPVTQPCLLHSNACYTAMPVTLTCLCHWHDCDTDMPVAANQPPPPLPSRPSSAIRINKNISGYPASGQHRVAVNETYKKNSYWTLTLIVSILTDPVHKKKKFTGTYVRLALGIKNHWHTCVWI